MTVTIERMREISAAFNSRDVARIVDCFAEDGVFCLALQLRFFRGQGRRCGDLPKVAVELPRFPDLLTVAAAQNARERQSQSTNEINTTVVLRVSFPSCTSRSR